MLSQAIQFVVICNGSPRKRIYQHKTYFDPKYNALDNSNQNLALVKQRILCFLLCDAHIAVFKMHFLWLSIHKTFLYIQTNPATLGLKHMSNFMPIFLSSINVLLQIDLCIPNTQSSGSQTICSKKSHNHNFVSVKIQGSSANLMKQNSWVQDPRIWMLF